MFIPAAFTRLLGAGRMRISYGLERVLFRLRVWLCLPGIWGSSDLKECSEFTYDGAFLSAVSSASWTPLPKTLSYESWLVLC